MPKLVLDYVVWANYDVSNNFHTRFSLALILTLNLTWARTPPERRGARPVHLSRGLGQVQGQNQCERILVRSDFDLEHFPGVVG